MGILATADDTRGVGSIAADLDQCLAQQCLGDPQAIGGAGALVGDRRKVRGKHGAPYRRRCLTSPPSPDLGELLRRFASKQVRSVGTVGGNIANGSPIGDTPPALIALGATLVLQRGAATRELALEDFLWARRIMSEHLLQRVDDPPIRTTVEVRKRQQPVREIVRGRIVGRFDRCPTPVAPQGCSLPLKNRCDLVTNGRKVW
jgi:FAD binding domain in molybdopterin dehydrogenase